MRMILLMIGLLVSTGVLAEVADFKTARRTFIETLDKIAAERTDRLQTLQTGYLKNLQDNRKTQTASGNLDNVMAVRAEIERVTNWVEPTESDRQKLPADLQAMRRQYDAGVSRIIAEALAKSTELRQTYARDLEAQQRRLTQLDQIDAALLVKKERDQLLETLKAAPPAPPTAPPPVAAEVPAVKPAAPGVEKKISIRAFIDGSEELLISGLRIWYVHPSRGQGQREPTVINGQNWQPVWRDGKCLPFDRLMTMLPSIELPNLEVKMISGPGTVRILNSPNRLNHYQLSIMIENSRNKPSWHEFEIAW